MSAQTTNERKQAERTRKRKAGLKLVQVWLLPELEDKAKTLEKKSLKKVGLDP